MLEAGTVRADLLVVGECDGCHALLEIRELSFSSRSAEDVAQILDLLADDVSVVPDSIHVEFGADIDRWVRSYRAA
jgi:hypothetical protein